MPSSRTENRFGSGGYKNTSKQVVAQPVPQSDNPATDSLYSKYGVDPNSKTKAADLQTAISREQYDDHKSRFGEWFATLKNQVSDGQISADKRRWSADIARSSDQAYQNGLIGAQLNKQRFGVNDSARSSAANQSLGLLGQAKNRLSQTNKMTQDINDRKMALLNGQRSGGM